MYTCESQKTILIKTVVKKTETSGVYITALRGWGGNGTQRKIFLEMAPKP